MSYIKVLTLNNGFLFSVFSICFLILTVFSVFFSVFFPCENAIVYSKYLFLTTGRDQRGTLCELTGSESLKSPPTILGGGEEDPLPDSLEKVVKEGTCYKRYFVELGLH